MGDFFHSHKYMPPKRETAVTKHSKKSTPKQVTKQISEEDIPDDMLCNVCYDAKFAYKCPSCGVKVCFKCLGRYISELSNITPHCVQCQTALPFDVIFSALGCKGFEVYHTRSGLLRFELETQQIPDCLECCRICRKIEELEKSKKEIASNPITDGLLHIYRTSKGPLLASNAPGSVTVTDKQINDIIAFINVTFQNSIENINNAIMLEGVADMIYDFKFTAGSVTISQLNRITDVVYNLARDYSKVDLNDLNELYTYHGESVESIIRKFTLRDNNKKPDKAERISYVFRCSNENCKGFVDTSYTCQLCQQHYCEKCFKPIKEDVEHTCDVNDIATAEDLKTNTKPCPNCAAPVFKVSGCSQMFCINCRVGFDWYSGKIIKGNFHNPDRLRWIQEHGNVTIDVGECHDNDVYRIAFNRFESRFRNIHLLFRLYQYRHITAMINANNNKLRAFESEKYAQRCRFVLNKITQDEYIEWCTKWEFTRHKVEMITGIYNEFTETARDLLYSCYIKRMKLIDELSNELPDDDYISQLPSLLDVHLIDAEGSGLVDTFERIRKMKHDNERTKLINEWFEMLFESASLEAEAKQARQGFICSHERKGGKVVLIQSKHCEPIFDIIEHGFSNFVDELNLFNELTNHVDEQLTQYKRVFKVPRITRPINEGDKRAANAITYSIVA